MQLPHVSMDVSSADFGQCADMRLIHKQTVNMTNHTNGKITVMLMGGAVFCTSLGLVYT